MIKFRSIYRWSFVELVFLRWADLKGCKRKKVHKRYIYIFSSKPRYIKLTTILKVLHLGTFAILYI